MVVWHKQRDGLCSVFEYWQVFWGRARACTGWSGVGYGGVGPCACVYGVGRDVAGAARWAGRWACLLLAPAVPCSFIHSKL